MNSHVKLGSLYGVPVGLHWSWFLIFILLSWSLAIGVYAPQFPSQGPALHWGLGITTSVLLFASVLAHEFGHALVSIRNNIPVERITLFIFGGVAQIAQEPQSPGVEFRISIAGPLVSLALAVVFGLVWLAAGSVPVLATGAHWLAEINLTLVLFNIIPAFPLDGGRVLRSIVWAWKKDYLKATRIATLVGQGISYLFIITGIFFISRGNFSNGTWLAFIGWFLHNAAQASRLYAENHPILADVRANQVMDRRIGEIPADLSVCDLVTTRVVRSGKRSFVVSNGQRPLGMITIREIAHLPRDAWEVTRVRDVMVPWDRMAQITPNTTLSAALQSIDLTEGRLAPVMFENRVEGIVSRDMIMRHLRQQR